MEHGVCYFIKIGFQSSYLFMSFIKKHPFVPAFIFLIISIILLTLPGNSLPKAPWLNIPYLDKCIHFCLFTTLCFLFAYPLKYTSFKPSKKMLWIIVISVFGIVYGTAMEFVQQYWIPNRSFELLDIGADTLGSVFAFLLSSQLLVKKQISRPS